MNAWKRIIKTQSICVYGENLAPAISRIKPGTEMVAHLFSLESDLQRDGSFDRKICAWLMKRIVRSGFELVMERAQTFTRDLYPCYEHFTRYYPDREAEMRTALELAVFPTDEWKKAQPVVEGLGNWLAQEGAKWRRTIETNAPSLPYSARH